MRFFKCLLLLALLGGCQKDVPAKSDALRTVLQVPYFRNPLKATLVESWKQRDLIFEQVQFQGRYNQWIPALICYSELARFRPQPVILCMPGSSSGKEDLLRPLDLIPRWADQGFFIVSIDRPYQGERKGDLGLAINDKGLLKIWGEYVYDLMRAIDYVETRDEADSKRIGMLGLSMGGVEALLMGALDTRVDVVVSVAGQLVWEEVFRGDSWKRIFNGLDLGRGLIQAGVSGEQAWSVFREAYPNIELVDASRVASQAAPKPLLLVTGENDPYITPASTRKVFEVARTSYAAHEKEEQLELWIAPDVAHSFPPQLQARALEFFVKWL